jgi:hypothetical protein
MPLFDENGRIKDEVYLVYLNDDGTCSVDTYLLGRYDGSFPRQFPWGFPKEVAVVFI